MTVKILILATWAVSNLMMLFVIWWICDKHARFERETNAEFKTTWLVIKFMSKNEYCDD